MVPNTLSENKKRALVEFKNQLQQKLAGEILALKLFGSYARGEARKGSDIDVLIVLKTRTPAKEKTIFSLVASILLEYGVDLSVKVFSEQEFKEGLDLYFPFFLNVEKEAVAI